MSVTSQPSIEELKVPVALRPTVTAIVAATDAFCERHLDREYSQLCRRLVGRLARKRASPLVRGDTTIWAAGVIYTVGSLNFLFDRAQVPHLRADELAARLGVAKSTMANKAARIRGARRGAPTRTDPGPRPSQGGVSHAFDLADLDSLVAELTVDAYGDEEQLTGLLTGAEEALSAGETATVVGVPVQITAVTAGPDMRRGLIAVCKRGGKRHEISLADVTFDPDSELGRVAAAYRRWLGIQQLPAP